MAGQIRELQSWMADAEADPASGVARISRPAGARKDLKERLTASARGLSKPDGSFVPPERLVKLSKRQTLDEAKANFANERVFLLYLGLAAIEMYSIIPVLDYQSLISRVMAMICVPIPVTILFVGLYVYVQRSRKIKGSSKYRAEAGTNAAAAAESARVKELEDDGSILSSHWAVFYFVAPSMIIVGALYFFATFFELTSPCNMLVPTTALILDEPSGLTYHPGFQMVVSVGVTHWTAFDIDTYKELATHRYPMIGGASSDGIVQAEGVTFMYNSTVYTQPEKWNDRIFILAEEGYIYVFNVFTGKFFRRIDLPKILSYKDGYESLTFVPDAQSSTNGGYFYAGVESKGCLYRYEFDLSKDNTGVTQIGDSICGITNTVGGSQYVPHTDSVLVISKLEARLREVAHEVDGKEVLIKYRLTKKHRNEGVALTLSEKTGKERIFIAHDDSGSVVSFDWPTYQLACALHKWSLW